MKYTIYKLNKKLGKDRWWRNYDANHKNASDKSIETYLQDKGYSWEPWLNTKNEPIKYQTISKDSFNEIEIYTTIDNLPDYIKIELDTGDKKEYLYYYVKNPPTIYNATNNIAVEVKYELDKMSSYYYMFHSKLINDDPNLFFVRKHTNRFKQMGNWWYYDFNEQPYLKANNDQVKNSLVVVSKTNMSNVDTAIQALEPYLDKFIWEFTEDGYFRWHFYSETEFRDTFKVKLICNKQEKLDSTDIDVKFNDEIFNNNGRFEYVVVKPTGWVTEPDNVVKLSRLTSYMIFPIPVKGAGQLGTFGSYNNYFINAEGEIMSLFINEENIIGRFFSNESPLTLLALNSASSSLPYDEHIFNKCFAIANDKDTYKDGGFACILSDGLPHSFKLTTPDFALKLNFILENINKKSDYRKAPINNPHLVAPQYFQCVYASSTNDKSIITADYIDTKTDERLEMYINTFVTSDWYTRLLVNNWSTTKLLSQAGNELTCPDSRQAPIQCSAYNNTYLQKYALDNSRNNQLASGGSSIFASLLTFLAGAVLTSTGVGTPIGIGAMLASGLSIGTRGINLTTGMSQIAMNKKILTEQPSSLNNPVGINGLTAYDTWATNGYTIYTLGLSDNDIYIVNADDNMFGYYVTEWLPYTNYLNCWHGNYMLCDISKNYSTLFTKLKELDSIFTIDDTYINDFLEALNNGITWFADGIYRDLATDDQNWERVFPQPTN